MRHALILLLAIGCAPSTSVPRSAEIACQVQADCPGKGRTCINGTCRLKTSACVEPVGDRFQLIADGVPCALTESVEGVCSDGTCHESSCGDGIVHAGVEECDSGGVQTIDPCAGWCNSNCTGYTAPYCGDGAVCGDEECDDGPGNSDLPDSCRSNCRLPTCGDGIADTGEECDDQNLTEEDGCNTACQVLPGWGCWSDRDPPCTPVVYVKPGATAPNGRSWETAYPDLNQAILEGTTPEIWIAEGTYTPLTTAGFWILRDLRLVGGFAGNETLGERREAGHETVLSGDLNGDDPADDTDNAGHVLDLRGEYLSTIDTVILDRLTISGGNPDSDVLGAANGGGIIARGFPRLVIRNCRLENNRALDSTSSGGGIWQNGGELDLEDVLFLNNEATNYGGAIWVGAVTMTARNCTFEGNTASGSGGGAIASNGARILIDSSHFHDNDTSISAAGGAIGSRQGSLRIKNSTFVGNNAGYGGAIHAYPWLGGNEDDLVVIDDSVFVDNEAASDGGAIRLKAAQARVAGCVFADNRAIGGQVAFDGSGGAIFAEDNVIANNVFFGNDASRAGSALVILKGRVIGNTMVNNTTNAALYVGFSAAAGVPEVANNILWSNPGGSVDFFATATPSSSHNCVENGWVGPGDDSSNVDVDPQFAGTSLPVTETDIARLCLGIASPLLDAGDNTASALFAADVIGNPRFLDGDADGSVTVDIGAFESCPP